MHGQTIKALVIGSKTGQVARELSKLDEPGFAIELRGRPDVDLARPQTLEAALSASRADIVINAGAYTAVDQAEREPEIARAINGDGAGALARACASAGLPLIHLSTDYVFDGEKTSPYGEADATAPLNAYGASKLEGEQRIIASSARHVILRTSWVHAAHGRNFVRTMLRLARSRERISVVADQIGRPTYAAHLAIAIRDIAARLLLDPSAQTGIFHLTESGEPCSWRQFAQTIFEASQVRGGPYAIAEPVTTLSYPTPARRPAYAVLDCSRIASAYGLTMPGWREGVEACVESISLTGWPEEQTG